MNYLTLTRWFTYVNEAQTIIMGIVPGPAIMLKPFIIVKTAFNGGGTDLLRVGTSGDTDAFGTDYDLSSTNTTPVDFAAGVSLGYHAAGQKVQLVYSRSGTAPTAGESLVVQPYIRVPIL